MPPVTSPTYPEPVAVPPAWAPVAITARGRAACRLQLGPGVLELGEPAGGQWFASWLNELLIDAVLGETA